MSESIPFIQCDTHGVVAASPGTIEALRPAVEACFAPDHSHDWALDNCYRCCESAVLELPTAP